MHEAEFDSLNATVQSLGREFLTMSAADIASLVAAEYRRFRGSPVREFVPMLVESAVREELRERELRQAS